MSSNEPASLGQLWARFERASAAPLTSRGSGVAMLSGICLWLLWLAALPAQRLSVGVLGLFVAIGLCYALVELRTWRHWRAAWLLWWSYRQQVRLHGRKRAENPGLGQQVDELMSAATPGSDSWAEIRSKAQQLSPPAREHVLLLADVFNGRPWDASRLRSAIGDLASTEERCYWSVGLAMIEGLAAYQAGGDYLGPLNRASRQLGCWPCLIAHTALRFVVADFYVVFGVVVALTLTVVWNA
jgi:hypothetical protein